MIAYPLTRNIMIEPDALDQEADREEDRAATHTEAADELRRHADEERETQAREEEAHEED